MKGRNHCSDQRTSIYEFFYDKEKREKKWMEKRKANINEVIEVERKKLPS